MPGQQLWRQRLGGTHGLLRHTVEIDERETKRRGRLVSRRVHDSVQPRAWSGDLDQAIHQAFSFVGAQAVHDVPCQHDVVGTWARRQL